MARDHKGVLLPSRRSFCSTLIGVLVAPSVALAQASKAVRRIGWLGSGAPATPEEIWREAEPLRELGWVEGQNLRVERRYDNGRAEALQPLAEELVRAQVEIILTNGTPATVAAKRATSTIPILIEWSGDPVLLGLVASLARPGGNVTGYTQASPELYAKHLSLLKELLPRLQRIGVLMPVGPVGNPYYRAASGQLQDSCQLLGLDAVFVEVAGGREIVGAIAQLVREHAQALMLPSEAFFYEHRFEIVGAATTRGLPTISDYDIMVREAGALMSYSASEVEHNRIRAEYIDRILRGAKPADLPVRRPAKFELVINLKTARALELPIPKELLLRADEVIQ